MSSRTPSDPEPGRVSATVLRRDAQARVNEAAIRVHGVFSLYELAALGVPERTVQWKAQAGLLHRLYPGVYSIVPRNLLSQLGRFRAAVLACGRGAALSHASAADLADVRASHSAYIDVTVPGRSRRRLPGIRIHRSTTLRPEDVTMIDGIPVTTIARTVLDLAETLQPRQLEWTLDRLESLGLLDLAALREQIDRAPTRSAAQRLKRALDANHGPSSLTRSELEERFLLALRAAGVPAPECNALLHLPDGDPIHPDFIWREFKIIVELDGFRTHGTRRSFELDRRRDQRVSRFGWRPIRGTWRQVEHAPGELVEVVLALIGASRPQSRAA